MFKRFRDCVLRGNVVDLLVGVVISAAGIVSIKNVGLRPSPASFLWYCFND